MLSAFKTVRQIAHSTFAFPSSFLTPAIVASVSSDCVVMYLQSIDMDTQEEDGWGLLQACWSGLDAYYLPLTGSFCILNCCYYSTVLRTRTHNNSTRNVWETYIFVKYEYVLDLNLISPALLYLTLEWFGNCSAENNVCKEFQVHSQDIST